MRYSTTVHAPLYQQRAEFVANIPHFWSIVFEQAPNEIDGYIQPSDSKALADCLDTFEVSRFEIDDPKGSPRSFSFKFGFKENVYFEDKVLEKKFWYRKSKDWAGLVSEPVRINWKEGNDLTGGLTDAACALHEARIKLGHDSADEKARQAEKKLPEYKALSNMLEQSHDSSTSFFGIFAFVSGYRWVSAEESERVTKEEKEQMEKFKRGERVEEDDKDDDEEEEGPQDHQDIEVFPDADQTATIIAEDVWPNAIRYYSESLQARVSPGQS